MSKTSAAINRIKIRLDSISGLDGKVGDLVANVIEPFINSIVNFVEGNLHDGDVWDAEIIENGKITGWIHKKCGRKVEFKEKYCPECGEKMNLLDDYLRDPMKHIWEDD